VPASMGSGSTCHVTSSTSMHSKAGNARANTVDFDYQLVTTFSDRQNVLFSANGGVVLMLSTVE
jgi:hypothetical protein